jgi:hypothetical protein
MKNQSIQVGAELLRQGFMAVDYLEMRLVAPLFTREVRSGSEKINTTSTEEGAHVAGPRAKSESRDRTAIREYLLSDRGDVPGWVLVVLMTTGLVTAIWAVAAPRLNTILRNSLDSMNNIR